MTSSQSRRVSMFGAAARASMALGFAAAALAGIAQPVSAAAPGDPLQNSCSATTPNYRAGLTPRTVQIAGAKGLDTAGYDVGTVLGEGDMMTPSADGRYLYTVTETTTGGQVQRVDIATGETRIIAQSGWIEEDADGKQLKDAAGKPLTGWRRLDPIKWLPGGKDLIIGEEDNLGRNYIVNPVTGEFHALDATGWFEHEGYAFTPDGTFYQASELAGGGLYRFIPTKAGDYSAGKLAYLLKDGTWKDVTDPRKAQAQQLADTNSVGFQRVEDMELGPDGYIYGAETAWPQPGGSPFNVGRVFRFKPGDRVTVETFVTGGIGFAMGEFQWPDNLVFDNKGNLIIAEDIPDDTVTPATNNSTKQFNNQQDDLWLVTPDKQAFRLASMATSAKAAPCQNEWTGPVFNADYSVLYIHQQHAENPLIALSGYQAAIANIGPRQTAPLPPNTGNSADESGTDWSTGALAVAVALLGAGAGLSVVNRRRS